MQAMTSMPLYYGENRNGQSGVRAIDEVDENAQSESIVVDLAKLVFGVGSAEVAEEGLAFDLVSVFAIELFECRVS